MYDFYPGFKLEEECFAKAIIKDVNQSSTSKSKLKSDLDQEPMTWPREKSGRETSYERFLEEVINPKTGEFYPERDKDNTAIKNTGATYYITDIYRIRRATGEEFLYTKGTVYGFDSLGDPIRHSISMPEIWTKTNFSYKTKWNEKANQLEKELQGPSGNPEKMYTLPFNKENLKEVYDKRQNDLVNFIVRDEQTEKTFQIKDVNSAKTFELFQKPFVYLYNAQYLAPQVKAELRQQAVAEGLIRGNISDFQPPSTTTGKNTYQ
jgi:hypothetical protein